MKRRRGIAAAIASMAGATALVLGTALPASANVVSFGGATCGSFNRAGGQANSIGTTTFTFYNPSASPNTYVTAKSGGSSYSLKTALTNWTQHAGGNANSSSVASASAVCLAT